MSMPSAARVSDIASFERVETCPRDGAPFVASRGCRICVFDAKYAIEPLGHCSECGAGLSGEELSCGSCLHAALLADARADVAAWVNGGDYADTDAALAPATKASAGSGDAALTDEERGHLIHKALLAEVRAEVECWVEGEGEDVA